MSTTYSIVCDDCKVTYWCGQSDYFYSPDKLMRFMKEHCGHNIRFLNDLATDDDEKSIGYEDWELSQDD